MSDIKQAGMFHLRLLDEVTSTNDEIKRAIDAGQPEGFAVEALSQVAGYGRRGRLWESPKGGMYVSCLLRPHVKDKKLSTLSLVAALAVCRALEEFIPREIYQHIGIKWPNDVVYCAERDSAGRQYDEFRCDSQALDDSRDVFKLCGISLEVYAGAVCVGIGVNVFAPTKGDLQFTDSKNIPAYVSDFVENSHSLSVEQVCVSVLMSLTDVYKTWQEQGFAVFLPEYKTGDYLVGRHVLIENRDGDRVAEGIAEGINEQGALLIRCVDTNRIVAVSSGEVHMRSQR